MTAAAEKGTTVGVGNWYHGGSFDNLAVNGRAIALTDSDDSVILVQRYSLLPTGEGLVEGKTVSGWTLNGNVVEIYNGYIGTYKAVLVDTELDDSTGTYKTQLSKKVAELSKVSQGDYSNETWTAFQTVLSAATQLLENEEATEKDYQETLASLIFAYESLAKASSTDVNTDVYNFESIDNALDFQFYHSDNSGFLIQDGKLVHNGGLGETKAILTGEGRTYESVSIDIYPDENKNINAAVYLGASNVHSAVNKIDAIAIMVETLATDSSRVTLSVGNFPEWERLDKTIINNANKNALFADGAEPLKLKIDIEGKVLTLTLSSLNEPSKFVTTTYEYTGDYNLENGAVGIRSLKSANSFDNFTVVYTGGSIEKDEDGVTTISPIETIKPVQTGDFNSIVFWCMSMMAAMIMIVGVFCLNKRREG